MRSRDESLSTTLIVVNRVMLKKYTKTDQKVACFLHSRMSKPLQNIENSPIEIYFKS